MVVDNALALLTLSSVTVELVESVESVVLVELVVSVESVEVVELVESVELVELTCPCLRAMSGSPRARLVGAPEVRVARKPIKRKMTTAAAERERDIVTEVGEWGRWDWILGWIHLKARGFILRGNDHSQRFARHCLQMKAESCARSAGNKKKLLGCNMLSA